MAHFRWSDAWLLESIWVASPTPGARAPLAEVLVAADGVNKATMMVQELNGGVSRLGQAGYVMLHEDLSLSLTPAGTALVDEARDAAARGPEYFREGVERMLGVTPWTRDDDPRTAGDERDPISPEAMHAAEKAYRKKLRRERRKRSAEE
jgi:hypothetical protein